jgi:hypothetical protein
MNDTAGTGKVVALYPMASVPEMVTCAKDAPESAMTASAVSVFFISVFRKWNFGNHKTKQQKTTSLGASSILAT